MLQCECGNRIDSRDIESHAFTHHSSADALQSAEVTDSDGCGCCRVRLTGDPGSRFDPDREPVYVTFRCRDHA